MRGGSDVNNNGGSAFAKDSYASDSRLSSGFAAATTFSPASSGGCRRSRWREDLVVLIADVADAGRLFDLFHRRILSRDPNCSSVNDSDAIFPGV